MAGFGDFGLGLAEGIQKGRGLRRQDEEDVRVAEDRQQAKEDRGLRLKQGVEDRQYTTEQRGVQAEQQARQLKAQQFSDAHTEAGRKVAPFVIGKDPLGAVDVIENEFNTTPAFSNGIIHKIARDAAGKPIVDKDGLITLSVINQADNKEIKSGQVDPRAYIGWFHNIDNPWSAVQAEQDEAASEAKRQKVRGEKNEDYVFGLNAKTDAEIRKEKTLGAAGLGGIGRKSAPKEIQLFNFWKQIYPNETNDQLSNRVNAGRKKDPHALMSDMVRSYMTTTGEADLTKARQQVEKAFPELSPNYVEKGINAPEVPGADSGAASAEAGVDDIATTLGF